MDRSNLRIVFLGNPEFARFQLEHLLNAGFNIVGVVSAPDRAAGRGMNLRSTPVTEYARAQQLPLLQPSNLKDPGFLEQLNALAPDILVVIAFRMLPEMVWSLPPQGTINLHASLLPNYRGAAPINWAIINGERETGVTTFKLKHRIDTGNVLLQDNVPIGPDDTAGTLHDRLMVVGAGLMERTLDGIIAGSLVEMPQTDSGSLNEAPKLFSEDCRIHWDRNGKQIVDLIRGLCPYPVAYTELNGKRLKIFSARFIAAEHALDPGTAQFDKESLQFACTDGFIEALDVQLEGKRRMPTVEFMRGFGVE